LALGRPSVHGRPFGGPTMKNEHSTALNDPSRPERRRHRVYVTHNTEYHIRDRRCVAVRDRRTGEFLQGHLALDRSVAGGLKFFVNGGIAPNLGEPRPGESLYFASEGRDLVTSPLESVERPPREVVLEYPHARQPGESGQAGQNGQASPHGPTAPRR
jgi:hypothetical protein